MSSKGIPTRFMDERGKAGKCWTVPAAWPHEFDADATVQDDHAAADWFMSRFNAVDAKFREIPAERRKAQVARLLGVKA